LLFKVYLRAADFESAALLGVMVLDFSVFFLLAGILPIKEKIINT